MLFSLFSKKFKFLDQTALPTSKKVVYKFPYELPNDFRHRISGNQEIMEKSQKWVELEPSTKSPLGKKNTLVPKISRNQISKFLILYGFVWFLGIVSLILFSIVSLFFKARRTLKSKARQYHSMKGTVKLFLQTFYIYTFRYRCIVFNMDLFMLQDLIRTLLFNTIILKF